MNIGYACLAVGVHNTELKSCISKNANNEKLSELISNNLNSLSNIIDYNIKNQIKLFRISSDLIPFGSSPINSLPWWDIFSTELQEIGKKVLANGIRVSMHPGQYTVLNSPNNEVVERAIEDLNYHTRVLDSLGVGANHKIVLHIGGIYNEKTQAIKRFIINYQLLDVAVKSRLVIENDDKAYNIGDVLEIGTKLNVPVIFDNLHNEINSCDKQKSPSYWINECKNTWGKVDGNQKIHYSQQDPLKRTGSHSNSISINEFMVYYQSIKRDDIDIMLEVKDKNLSAIKCINCTSPDRNIKALELEWSRYKYSILEKSQAHYLKIREMLKDKNEYPAIPFYKLIEEALERESIIGNTLNAAMHIWGYFKEIATEAEKNEFLKSVKNYEQGKISVMIIKKFLWKMAIKYHQSYLLDSYYFVL